MANQTETKLSFGIPRIKWALICAVAIGLIHGAFALLVLDHLPQTIPMHFDAMGRADGFSGVSAANWFLLWFVSVGTAVLTIWIALRIDRIPVEYISIPRKEAFLSLNAAARGRVFVEISFQMVVFAGMLMLFFLVLHLAIAFVALGYMEQLPPWLVYGSTVVLIAWSIGIILRIMRAIDQETDHRVKRT
ncbi:MAG: DUF1648 domain-containing protein [Myxococcota bacterium]|nr:DUF1648 domain-containing protein [Myxococcota bacterium]